MPKRVRASYYGRVEGAGTPVSRRGGKESGLRVVAATREASVEIVLKYDAETGKDVAAVILSPGNSAEPVLIWKGWI